MARMSYLSMSEKTLLDSIEGAFGEVIKIGDRVIISTTRGLQVGILEKITKHTRKNYSGFTYDRYKMSVRRDSDNYSSVMNHTSEIAKIENLS
jgi:hypothetical protein